MKPNIIAHPGCIHPIDRTKTCDLPCTTDTPHGWLCEFHDRKLNPLKPQDTERVH